MIDFPWEIVLKVFRMLTLITIPSSFIEAAKNVENEISAHAV